MPKELGLFDVTFLTVSLYIQWDQFIIVQVALPTPSNKVPSNVILDFKRLRMNLLNIVTLLKLKSVLGDHPTSLKKYWLFSNRNCQSKHSKRQEYCCSNCLCTFRTKSLSAYSSAFLSCIYYPTKKNGKKGDNGRSPRKSTWLGITLTYLSLDQGN